MKKYIILPAVSLCMLLASCDSYLDINEDPNSPAESNLASDMILPAAEMNIATSYGCYLRITGGYFSQQYAHYFGTSNYLDYSQFQQSATRSSSTYTQLYQRGLSNLETVREMAEADEEWGTYLAVTVLRALTFQALIDCYGETPYSEALTSNASPAYDEGIDVYNGILDELDTALGLASSSDIVATNFLYEGETATNWIKFANALKLRILMRMSDVEDVQSQLAALIAEDNFPTSDVVYDDCWSNASGSYNPFYAEDAAPGMQQNVVANLALIGTMDQDDYSDPRLAAYWNTNDSGEYFGGVSGTNFSNANSVTSGTLCRPNITATSPLYYITVAEIEFFKAEYYARYGTAANAEAHYNAAIEASFATAGVDGAAANIAAFPYDSSNYKKSIGIAKWVHLAGVNNFEAWCELRRLRYPAFGSVSGTAFYSETSHDYDYSSYVPGTLYTPLNVYNQVGNNSLLERWPYAESSSSRNSNIPTFKGYTTPVFWAE